MDVIETGGVEEVRAEREACPHPLPPETPKDPLDDSNAAILGHGADEYPPNLRDISTQAIDDAEGVINRLWEYWDTLPQVPLGLYVGWTWLRQIRLLYQLDNRLPQQLDQEAYHVYLVTSPHRQVPMSFRHWSLYTQGFFYHLSIAERDNKSRNTCNDTCSSGVSNEMELLLKVQNLSGPEQQDYVDARRGNKVFIAFEVGQTTYKPEHVERLAQWVIDLLGIYNLTNANCQIFNMALLRRIAMTQRDGTIFAGNLSQLVDWDLESRHSMSQHKPNSLETGVLIRSPDKSPQTLFRRFAIQWSGLRALTMAMRIRTLYEKGPHALGAYRPRGLNGEWKDLWLSTRELLHKGKDNLGIALGEFGEDIRAKHWKDALLGREESLKKSLNERLREKAEGARYIMPQQPERTFLFLRRILQSSDQEEPSQINELHRLPG